MRRSRPLDHSQDDSTITTVPYRGRFTHKTEANTAKSVNVQTLLHVGIYHLDSVNSGQRTPRLWWLSMASLFTFESEQRVSSPWLTPSDSPKPSTPQPSSQANETPPSLLADYGRTRLEAEPQDGPIEYKLHLLLRPRRTYTASSTTQDQNCSSDEHVVVKKHQSPAIAPSSERRQNRLEHLSTQLLWRLQQSSPYHSSNSSELVLPKLPEATSSLEPPSRPARLVSGLEESQGALYEIGVSDDGTLVGLTKDEMDESLGNLRAMAASLGCLVDVVKMVLVGNCEWHEPAEGSSGNYEEQLLATGSNGATRESPTLRHQADLWVAEAKIIPDLSSQGQLRFENLHIADSQLPLVSPKQKVDSKLQSHSKPSDSVEQLRITLTGPTTSGKSSLLGTLTSSVLDNGRGKSRLSLLKHRHEIESGITSSVTQDLIGYKNSEVINFASSNVESWNDIHASIDQGRLVLVSDSAGHPRYRRTTVRGLIGWAPHWTLLCIAADDANNAPSDLGGTSSAQDILGTAGAGIDLTKAHLELCLKLDIPLAIVITKLDLASKDSLKQTLSNILSAIKATGRVPYVLPPDQNKSVAGSQLGHIQDCDVERMKKMVSTLQEADSLTSIVPIILTSASKGRGIPMLHCLLQYLPVPAAPTAHDYTGPALNPEQPTCLFHIEDVFAKKLVVAGHSRFGTFSIGSTVVIGPFPTMEEEIDSQYEPGFHISPTSIGSTLFHPSTVDLTRMNSRNTIAASVAKGEWHNATITSIRNLRLPVHMLYPGQVGTIGLVFDSTNEKALFSRLKKGMIVAIPGRHMVETGLQAATGFSACFDDGDINSVSPGSLVVVYIASVRATAKVLRLEPHAEIDRTSSVTTDDADNVFGLDDVDEEPPEPAPLIFGSDGITNVTFELLNNREWIELGSQVLVMPGGGLGLYSGSERGEKGIAGLEGFVGKVMEVVDQS
ncbi:hypothetical protein B0O99DRAFT_604212 [Bisporella sp. PMI_857]|nr:hypothetical protein B0O99DRAFT_604212 [Bisporella sp. PMI_857]